MEKIKEIELRESTENIKLETSYCSKCKDTSFLNIGQLKCAICGENK